MSFFEKAKDVSVKARMEVYARLLFRHTDKKLSKYMEDIISNDPVGKEALLKVFNEIMTTSERSLKLNYEAFYVGISYLGTEPYNLTMGDVLERKDKRIKVWAASRDIIGQLTRVMVNDRFRSESLNLWDKFKEKLKASTEPITAWYSRDKLAPSFIYNLLDVFNYIIDRVKPMHEVIMNDVGKLVLIPECNPEYITGKLCDTISEWDLMTVFSNALLKKKMAIDIELVKTLHLLMSPILINKDNNEYKLQWGSAIFGNKATYNQDRTGVTEMLQLYNQEVREVAEIIPPSHIAAAAENESDEFYKTMFVTFNNIVNSEKDNSLITPLKLFEDANNVGSVYERNKEAIKQICAPKWVYDFVFIRAIDQALVKLNKEGQDNLLQVRKEHLRFINGKAIADFTAYKTQLGEIGKNTTYSIALKTLAKWYAATSVQLPPSKTIPCSNPFTVDIWYAMLEAEALAEGTNKKWLALKVNIVNMFENVKFHSLAYKIAYEFDKIKLLNNEDITKQFLQFAQWLKEQHKKTLETKCSEIDGFLKGSDQVSLLGQKDTENWIKAIYGEDDNKVPVNVKAAKVAAKMILKYKDAKKEEKEALSEQIKVFLKWFMKLEQKIAEDVELLIKNFEANKTNILGENSDKYMTKAVDIGNDVASLTTLSSHVKGLVGVEGKENQDLIARLKEQLQESEKTVEKQSHELEEKDRELEDKSKEINALTTDLETVRGELSSTIEALNKEKTERERKESEKDMRIGLLIKKISESIKPIKVKSLENRQDDTPQNLVDRLDKIDELSFLYEELMRLIGENEQNMKLIGENEKKYKEELLVAKDEYQWFITNNEQKLKDLTNTTDINVKHKFYSEYLERALKNPGIMLWDDTIDTNATKDTKDATIGDTTKEKEDCMEVSKNTSSAKDKGESLQTIYNALYKLKKIAEIEKASEADAQKSLSKELETVREERNKLDLEFKELERKLREGAELSALELEKAKKELEKFNKDSVKAGLISTILQTKSLDEFRLKLYSADLRNHKQLHDSENKNPLFTKLFELILNKTNQTSVENFLKSGFKITNENKVTIDFYNHLILYFTPLFDILLPYQEINGINHRVKFENDYRSKYNPEKSNAYSTLNGFDGEMNSIIYKVIPPPKKTINKYTK